MSTASYKRSFSQIKHVIFKKNEAKWPRDMAPLFIHFVSCQTVLVLMFLFCFVFYLFCISDQFMYISFPCHLVSPLKYFYLCCLLFFPMSSLLNSLIFFSYVPKMLTIFFIIIWTSFCFSFESCLICFIGFSDSPWYLLHLSLNQISVVSKFFIICVSQYYRDMTQYNTTLLFSSLSGPFSYLLVYSHVIALFCLSLPF